MQFKSIIAVLALAVAVAATPVDPVAVQLVPRTDPTPAPAPVVQTCKAGQVFVSKCTSNGAPVNTGTTPGGLLTILLNLISISLVAQVQCAVSGNQILSPGGICCNFNKGATTTTQNGLVNVANLDLLNCVAV